MVLRLLTDRSPLELTLPTDFKALVLVGIFSLMLLYALYITGEISSRSSSRSC